MERFPLDFDALEKGQTIHTQEIEAIYGIPKDDRQFRFKLMALRTQIEHERSDLLVRETRDALRIMTDREADEYLEGQTDKSVSRLKRTAARTLRVDRSDFTDAERRLSESRSRKATMIAMFAEKGRRESRKQLAEAKQAFIAESATD